MLTLTGATEISRRSAQHRHITVSRRPAVSIGPRNAVRAAYHALFPWSVSMNVRDREAYPGAFNGLCALVGKRASIPAIKFWISGRRNPPAWFVSLLRDRLLQRRAEIDQALTELEALPPRRGIGAGLRDWHRERKRRENEEQTALERKIEHNRILRGS